MSFLLRQLLSLVLVVWLTTTIAFFALRVLPGDAIEAQLVQIGANPAVIEERRHEQGLDAPLLLQYGRYLLMLVQGDFGYSLVNGESVRDMIGARLIPTLTLGLGAILIASIAGLLLGIVTGIDANKSLTRASDFLINLSLSTPIYWTGTFAIIIFAAQLQLLPAVGAGSFSQLILPASVLGFHAAGAIARMVKANIREAVSADFVRTARAKGLPESQIIWRHILRVGLLPTITVITIQLGFLLSGTVITENLFVRPGIGSLLWEGTRQQDYPVVQGVVVLAAVVYTVLNALADLVYRLADPRIAAV
jgi:peptide/nickel transport system permease protein